MIAASSNWKKIKKFIYTKLNIYGNFIGKTVIMNSLNQECVFPTI